MEKYYNYKNNLEIEGNLMKDPVYRSTEEVEAYIFQIASCFYPNENEKEVYYFDVEVWDKSLSAMCSQLKKGDRIEVIGRLKQHRWQDWHYNKLSKIVIIASYLTKKELNSGGQYDF